MCKIQMKKIRKLTILTKKVLSLESAKARQASRRFREVGKMIRPLLKRNEKSLFLKELEAVVASYSVGDLELCLSALKKTLTFSEAQSEAGELKLPEDPNGPLVLLFGDAFHRLLAHGVCQFYHLNSQSETLTEGNRVTIVQVPKSGRLATSPAQTVSLCEHLQRLSHPP
eukprot:205828_1